ncbi:MAG: helix-turn-helix domain-containing protein [Xanthomonadaceae bacterium]|nr:helix-turn-helix domain-containing protein [Xanthomonadaceae bacterium]
MQISKRGRPKGRSTDKRSFGPLGDLIRAHRIQKNLGLGDVAKAVKCSVQFISNIEHGRAPLPWDKTEQLAKFLEINPEELHAANLAIRSDFKSFIKTTGTKKVGKSQTALSGMKDTASLMTLTAQDLSLREIIQKYQAASIASKKKFVIEAKRMLVSE